MSETPPPNPPEGGAPPPTPDPPPGVPPPPASSDNTLMLVLSYLWLLALIPLLTEKDNAEVQWHAKNGLLFTAAEFVVWIALMVVQVIPGIGLIVGCGLIPILFLGFLVIHILAIVKATRGERFKLPVISDYADQWK